MAKVLILYYSSYGHIETMAQAVAQGVSETPAAVTLRRVPELVPPAVAQVTGYRMPQHEEIADVAELADHDAIIIGTPTRFGNMAAQMKNFLDCTGSLWAQDLLVGKVGSAFTSTGSQHGGQETTLQSTHTVLLHLGMIVVGLPYSFKGQLRMDEITGGSPYGATTLADDAQGNYRHPGENELAGARFQGRHVAQIALALEAGRQGGARP